MSYESNKIIWKIQELKSIDEIEHVLFMTIEELKLRQYKLGSRDNNEEK